MGITIQYRGTLDRLEDVEELEDRVTDIAFSLGGHATIWRSFSEHDRSRLVRGLIVEMAPGQDTLSLLISPEGHFIPLHQISAAEKGPLPEPPDCFVKTQFGGVEGHVAVAHLLGAIKARYCSRLNIEDESGFYDHRNADELAGKMRSSGQAIGMLADQLRPSGLSKEAAEDPNIVASRVQRIATLVHQKMVGGLKPDPPTEVPEWMEQSLEDEVDEMDRLRRKNDLRSERMARWIEEAMASGMSDADAFDLAMQKEGLAARCEGDPIVDPIDDLFDAIEPDNDEVAAGDQKHPAVIKAETLLMQFMDLPADNASPGSFPSIACRGAMDLLGGLAQATHGRLEGRIDRALAISQLKRALSGHAFAQGAVLGLRNEGKISDDQSAGLHELLRSILKSIHVLLHDAWDEPDFE
ncbi:hypothetical protein [Planctomycetes bacterium TBK1r]|uniref:Uncharacterized protein n=1 Tax=Stieleria magnilauensis TaxID=2527963 RepID=A0ABX5XSP7_9BACT|nr:hypothetical protein TBK1r_39810 [Planctomycetes bacterium TBK1r]